MELRERKTRSQTFRQGAFALLMTMLLLTLLIAGAAELATVTATEAVVGARRHRRLAHDLAVDSSLLVLADRLTEVDSQPSELIEVLDRAGEVSAEFTIGPARIECVIRDDGAKFNPLPFQEPHPPPRLARKLSTLGAKLGLPRAKVKLRPVVGDSTDSALRRYRWYDQILSDVEPGVLFRWDESVGDYLTKPVWSDVITFWGNGRIDLRRAQADVLEVALEDIRPGLGRTILSARPDDPSIKLLQTALIGVHAEIRQQVAARLTYDARRYAIRIDTIIGADRRRWYVVARIDGNEISIQHRSQLTW